MRPLRITLIVGIAAWMGPGCKSKSQGPTAAQLCEHLNTLASEAGPEVEQVHQTVLAAHCLQGMADMKGEVDAEIWREYAQCVQEARDYVLATRDCADRALASAQPLAPGLDAAAIKHDAAPGDAGASGAVPVLRYAGDRLEVYEIGEGEGPETTLRFRDVDARFLLWTLQDPREALAISVAGPRMSGVAKGPRSAVIDALLQREPALGIDRPGTLRGKGREVTLQFYAANGRDLLRLLADVGRINIVTSDSTLPRVDIAVDHAPFDGVVRSLARLFDRRIEIHGATYFLLGPEESLIEPPRLSKEKFDLQLGTTAPLGAILELIAATSDLAMRTEACTAEVEPVQLRRASGQELALALAFKSKNLLAPGSPSCPPLPRLGPEALHAESGYQLLALVKAGQRGAALLARGDELALLTEGATITSSTLEVTGTGTVLSVYAEQGLEPPDYKAMSPRALLRIGDENIVLGVLDGQETALTSSRYPGERTLRVDGDAMVLTWRPPGGTAESSQELRIEIP